jgi:DNA-binding beta-propeller fold protein YncE
MGFPNGEVTVLNLSKGDVVRRISTGTPLRVIVSPDSDLAYVANVSPRGDHLTVINLRTLKTRDIPGLRDSNGLAFSPILPIVFTKRIAP